MELKFELSICCHNTPSLQFNYAPAKLHKMLRDTLMNQYYDTEDYKYSHAAGAFLQGGSNLTEGWILIEFWKPKGAEAFIKYVENKWNTLINKELLP